MRVKRSELQLRKQQSVRPILRLAQLISLQVILRLQQYDTEATHLVGRILAVHGRNMDYATGPSVATLLAGFPVTENKCITCGSKDHRGNDCEAPGGGADPNRQKVWDEYLARKQAANKAKEDGSNAKGQGLKGKEGKGAKGRGERREKQGQVR